MFLPFSRRFERQVHLFRQHCSRTAPAQAREHLQAWGCEHADRRACLLDSMHTGVYACSIPQQGKTSPLHRPAAWPRGTQAPPHGASTSAGLLNSGNVIQCAKTRLQDWLEASCAQEGGRDGHDPTRVRVGSRGGYLRARCTRFPGTLAGRTCCGHRASVPARPGQCEYERVRGVRQGEEGHVQVHGLAALERPNSPAQGAGFGGE